MSKDLVPVEQGVNEKPEPSDLQPLLNYLQSQQGHEIASGVLKIVEDIKKATLEKTTSHAAYEKGPQAIIVVVVVGSASTLSYLGKFDTSLGVLFGTLVGYIFGKK